MQMEGIIKWIKNLIFIILFTALLEMFLPENNLRKYVRVIMGFFIINILISPLALILKQDFSGINNIIPETFINNKWGEIEEEGKNLNASNQDLMTDYYKKMIRERVSEVIRLGYPNFNEDIKVTLDDNYGIRMLKIVLVDPGVDNIEIAPVKIDGKKEEGEECAGEMLQKNYDTERLRYNLAQLFQIGQEKIEIYFKAGGR